jgi:hypothetical protein
MTNIRDRARADNPKGSEATVLDAARRYLERGWKPIPLPFREKRPIDKDWPKLKTTPENVGRRFNNERMNIGLQLGRRSGGLCDVDLDCAEARALAPHLLAPTDAKFGRRSTPCAHWLYVSDLYKTEQKAVVKYAAPKSLGGDTLLELRIGAGGKAAQTMAPPSQHPEGERVRWDIEGEPAHVDGAELKQWTAGLAVASLLARHFPAEGSRHEAALVLGGMLARVPGMEADDIEALVKAVAHVAHDDEWQDRVTAAKRP